MFNPISKLHFALGMLVLSMREWWQSPRSQSARWSMFLGCGCAMVIAMIGLVGAFVSGVYYLFLWWWL